MNTVMPTGWTSFSIADVGGISGGKTPSKANPNFWLSRDVPWVSPKDMKKSVLNDTEDRISQLAINQAGMTLYPANSVLMVTRSGILQHTFPVALAAVQLTVNQDIKVFRPTEGVVPKFFFYMLRSFGTDILSACAKDGTTVQSIDSEKLETFPLPLPPLAEQTRISAKLDELLAQIDTLKARIDGIPALLKHFRQSVLTAAVSGQLTEEWRHGAEVNWSYQRAADVCEKVQSGGTPKEGFLESGIPFLKVYNIVNQQIDFEYRPQYISKSVHHHSSSKSITLPGDVVMNIVGPPLGKVATIPSNHPEWNINQAITLFRPSKNIVSGWISIVLLGGENLRRIINETKGSAGQINISLSQCRDFVFPVPEVEEQGEIIRRVDKLFTFADQLEIRVKAAQARIDRLSQSILAKAFRGELVPQDPTDEPASVLLDRIKAQRAAAPRAKRSRRSATLG
ncbi:restriction endonuclease subunit S [Pseudomonas sp. zjy_8]|uniref:restriction endonuclease subunit S n=1 Tax=Pseudomonas sp. GLN_2 TaxID=3367180 RepID=UPI00370CA7F3